MKKQLKYENRRTQVAGQKQFANRNPEPVKTIRENSFSSASSLPIATRQPLIYGVLPILEALRAETRKIEKIFVVEGANEKRLSNVLGLAKQNGILLQRISRENLSKFVEENVNHQGIIAFVASAEYFDADQLIDEIASRENSLSVILDGVEDPRNLGAILRVVECVGAAGVFIPERRAVGLTETVAKSSAGAAEYVKVAKVANLVRLIENLKENNVWVVGTSADATMNYDDWDWKQSTALVLGSEGKGLHRLVAEKCDVLVKIPLHGKIESLNVSVAAGVILFEAVRQRFEGSQKPEK
jgi:23S rRNA (guanosine2251-2'-O)-methyltransferase